MTSIYPSHNQLTADNLKLWIDKFGPVRQVVILNPDGEGQPFEIELVLGE